MNTFDTSGHGGIYIVTLRLFGEIQRMIKKKWEEEEEEEEGEEKEGGE